MLVAEHDMAEFSGPTSCWQGCGLVWAFDEDRDYVHGSNRTAGRDGHSLSSPHATGRKMPTTPRSSWTYCCSCVKERQVPPQELAHPKSAQAVRHPLRGEQPRRQAERSLHLRIHDASHLLKSASLEANAGVKQERVVPNNRCTWHGMACRELITPRRRRKCTNTGS